MSEIDEDAVYEAYRQAKIDTGECWVCWRKHKPGSRFCHKHHDEDVAKTQAQGAVCTVCKVTPVDAFDGEDTCIDCSVPF